jgi:hypothetical protein
MDENERSEQFRKLYNVLTAGLEDAAAIAAEGQRRALPNELMVGQVKSHSLSGQEVVIFAQAGAIVKNQAKDLGENATVVMTMPGPASLFNRYDDRR